MTDTAWRILLTIHGVSVAFYTREALEAIGFASLGEDVNIDTTVIFIKPKNISIGSHVRIDAYSIFSGQGPIEIGNHVHISCYVSFLGQGKITLEDYVGVSAKSSLFSSNDDYSGEYLTGPTVPDEFKNVTSKEILIRKHVVVGAHSILLPGVTIGIGASVGSMSLVNRDVDDFVIVGGVPAKFLKRRSEKILEMEAEFEQSKS